MIFKIGNIEGIIIRDLKKYADERGWLVELFREDEISKEIMPTMSHASLTLPNVVRGPHEHLEQTDNFCFLESKFKIIMWDNRKESPTYTNKMALEIGEENPKAIVVPPRVVHCYKNIGSRPGLVINFPNRLYAGWKKNMKVDEIRHENDIHSMFKVD